MKQAAIKQPVVFPAEELGRMQEALKTYKKAKQEIDRNVPVNERWFRAKHWSSVQGEQPSLSHEPVTPFILNAAWNKHADAMDHFPEPLFLEREPQDRELAERLSKIIPLVLEKNEFEKIYSDCWWQKIKHGTGIYYVGWDSRKENGLGDIVISKVDLTRFYAQPHIDDLQKSQYIFVLSAADRQKLQQQYPDKSITADAVCMAPEFFEYGTGEELSRKVCLVDCYEKRRNANGTDVVHFTKFVGNTVLYSTRTDPVFSERGLYAHGMYPFVCDPFIPNENSIYGMGLVEILRPTQEYIDRLDYLMERNCLVAGRQRFIVKRSSGVRPDDVQDLSKEIIECDSSADDTVIRPLQAAAFPSYVMEHRQNKVEELKEIAGNRNIMQGDPGNITAYRSISMLQEAGNKLSRDILKSSYRSFRLIVSLCVELIREFYEEARSFRITGPEGGISYTTLSNRTLMTRQSFKEKEEYRNIIFDIRIVPKQKNVFDAEQHNNLIRDLYEAGAFSPEHAQGAIIALNAMMLENKDSIIKALEKIAK